MLRRANIHPASPRGRGFVRALLLALGLVSLTAVVPHAVAQEVAAEAQVQLEQDVARLKSELTRLHADVQSLKASPRSVRRDFLLRTRMADAESLGRRLTESESRLRALRGGGTAPRATTLGRVPEAAATDGPVELAAKADILLDQAQRLANEADRLEKQADRASKREKLRGGLQRLERDPFIGMEAQKRNLIFSSQRDTSKGTDGAKSGDGTRGGNTSVTDGASNSTELGGSSEDPGSGAAAPPAQDNGPVAPTAGAPTTGESPPREGPVVPSAGAVGSPPTGSDATTFGFHNLINPETMAEVRRLERIGTPASRAKAMQKAAEALREQSRRLQQRAGALRAGPGTP